MVVGEVEVHGRHCDAAETRAHDPAEALAVLVAGAVAGGVNAVVGSGSLVTFPTLLAVGYPPVTANVSNSVGLVPAG